MSGAGNIVVTGGSRGLGAAIARKLAALGHPVVVNYASNHAAADAVVHSIIASGGKAAAIGGDVADEAAVLHLFKAAEAVFGPITGLVNSAGITGGATRFADLTAEALNRTLAVNVTGSILCAREAVRRMSTRRGGHGGGIVNFSSAAARLGGPGELVHYAASKGAIESFTVGLAREVAEEGIRVNAVAPGLIDTEMNPPERLARLVPSVPIRRAGQPEEVAEAVAWLLSDAASYVTGTTITVSGGR